MNTEKTALEWFDLLIEPYCSQAKAAFKNQRKKTGYNETYEKLYDALYFGFNFLNIPNSEEFYDLIESINLGETTYLKQNLSN